MLLIVISPPETYSDEHKTLTILFNQGLEIFHLRKPDYSYDDMETYITSIPVEFHPRIVIHSHYLLANRYNLKGIHLTEKARKDKNIGKVLKTLGNKSLSASFHHLDELKRNRRRYDYVFLSPVFDSISKSGYKSNFDLSTIRKDIQLINTHHKHPLNIIALGGINAENIGLIKKTGFAGAALLGAVWESDDPLSTFSAVKNHFL
jgi:thiamine-phosphate pyrophosphorylase